MKQFNEEKKPIGLCCISPTIAAKVFPGCTVTVGSATESVSPFSKLLVLYGDTSRVLTPQEEWPNAAAASTIEAMGSKHKETTLEEVCVDDAHNLVTSAAYMCEAPVHRVHDNVAKMVVTVLDRA